MADSKLTALTEVSVADFSDDLYLVDNTGPTSYKVGTDRLFGLTNFPCQGRLTLTSGTAVTTSDVTGATSVYFTPYNGNNIAIYDGTRWIMYAFTELTLALGTITSGLPYDIFIYDNAGTLTLELLAWTNGTTRATALALQDGIYCKTGALTRRYLGTFYTTATTTTEDSVSKRFLWNYYNQVKKNLYKVDTTDSWSYNSATIRQANAAAGNKVEVINGMLGNCYLDINVSGVVNTGVSSDGAIGIGEDVTTAFASTCNPGWFGNIANAAQKTNCQLRKFVPLGYHYYAWLEAQNSTSTATTFYGDAAVGSNKLQSGMFGNIDC